MSARTAASRIRLGTLALPVGTLFILASIPLYERIDPTVDPRGYAEFASSARFAFCNFLWVIGHLLTIFGFVALYAYLTNSRAERWALVAMILCVVGVAASSMWVALDSADAVAGELYLSGQEAFLEQRYASFLWIDTFLIIANSVFFFIGLVLFGIAIWRSGNLPRGAAILWIASPLLFPVAGLGAWAEAIQFALIVIASGWIAWSILRDTPPG